MSLYTAYFSLVAAIITLVLLPKAFSVVLEILEPYVPATMSGKLGLFAFIAAFFTLTRYF